MKRKVFDLRPWSRARRHTQTVLHVPGFVIVDFTAHEVGRVLDVPFGERTVRILDDGFRWVRVHPTGTGEGTLGDALTAMLDASGAVRQLYVDLHGGEGVGEDGLPWCDDLYLDVIADWTPDGRVSEVHVIDGDELEEAVRGGQVASALAEAAWDRAWEVEAALRAGTYPPLRVMTDYLRDPYT